MLVLILTKFNVPNNSKILYDLFSDYNREIVGYNNDEDIVKMFSAYQNDCILIIKANSIIVDKDQLFNLLNSNYDITYFNKNKDECEHQVKINNELRYSVNPNSTQCVLFNRRSMDYITQHYKGDNFKEYLNTLALHSKVVKLTSVVSSHNVVEFDINLSESIDDLERLIQCDYPYKKNKMYNTNIKLLIFFIVFIVILVGVLYLLLTCKNCT